MSKVWIAVALVAAAAGAAAGYVLVRARMPDVGPAGPNRDLAPESLACYAEVADGAGLWTKMSGTDAWNDLAASKLASAVTEAGPVKEFLAALEQVATKAGYRIDATNAMKLVGREFSVGVKLDPAGGVPQVLVLTKLDTAALAKDLLKGGTDLDALWAEMQRRTGSLDFKVTASDHRGQKMAAATRGDASYHAALLGDTLAISTDAALLRAAIDCRLDGGKKSLGQRAAFQADLKALPGGASVVEWYDLDALDAGRASLDAGLARFSKEPALAGAVHAVLDGTKGAHSYARATTLPEGDLYRLTWAYSKGDDLFADRASPAIASVLPGEWGVYGEFHQIGGVVDAWRRSSLKRNLAAGELGKWVRGAMDDPSKPFARVKEMVERFAPGMNVEEDEDEDEAHRAGKEAVNLVSSLSDRFTVQMAKHLAEQGLDSLLKGDGAFAVDAAAEGAELPRFAFVVRLDTEGRLLGLAAQGAVDSVLERHKDGPISSEICGTRRVWSIKGTHSVHYALVGDAVLLSDDLELVRNAAKSGGSAAPPSGRVAEATAALKPGWRALFTYDTARIMKLSESGSGGGARRHSPFGPEAAAKLYDEMGIADSRVAVAVYVPDDFAAIEFRTWTALGTSASENGRAMRAESSEMREPGCWASLPDTTIGHGTAPGAGVRILWTIAKWGISLLGGDMASIENGFRDSMKMDLEKELIPALGREAYFAVTFKAPPPGPVNPDGPPAVLPGVILGFEVKDQAVVKKALDRAIELAEAAVRESPNAPAKNPFVREAHEGVDIVRVDIPRDQMPLPISPACALHDGFLVLTLDSSSLVNCIDVRKGKAPGLAASPVFAAATAELGRKCASFMLLDWNRLADEVAVYAPTIGGLFASEDVSYPDFPEDGNQEEWKRRVEEYQKKMSEGRGAGEAKARKWIDAFRVIDWIGSSATWTGDTSNSTFIVRFTK